MAQFSMIPEREKILARLPDYAVEMVPVDQTVRIMAGDSELANSSRALLVRETRHSDVFYLPREDVDMTRLAPTGHSTYCPFKGHASYWTLTTDRTVIENVVWSYESPYPEVEPLRDYLSFYTDKVSVLAQ